MARTKKTVKAAVKPKRRRTIFQLTAPEAGEVFLAGDFNGWDLRKHPMKKETGGVWKRTTLLFPGEYEYKFLVDDRWCTDPENDRTCWNRFGTQNNVVEVKSGKCVRQPPREISLNPEKQPEKDVNGR